MKTFFAIVSLLLLNLNAAPVESRRHAHTDENQWSSMFVFGDDFADNGNLPEPEGLLTSANVTQMTRQWYFPYGCSAYTEDNEYKNPLARFSDGTLQSDFIAKMLGLTEAPRAYKRTPDESCDASGMTLAFGGSGVYEAPETVPTLAQQVDIFRELVKGGTISKHQLHHSVALVAISGNDYSRVGVDLSDFSGISAFIEKVTAEIVSNVERIQRLGVRKILVNNLPPLGCAPSQTRPNNYTICDGAGNYGASLHNSYLKQKMGDKHNAYIVDLNSAFTNFVAGDSDEFETKLDPCCQSIDPEGFCGQMGEGSYNFRYYLCDDHQKFFYFDEVHPTQAGWEAVMKQLQDCIQEFLDCPYVD